MHSPKLARKTPRRRTGERSRKDIPTSRVVRGAGSMAIEIRFLVAP